MEKEFPIIETARLILRAVTPEDADDMFHYLSDQDAVKHMRLVPFQTVSLVRQTRIFKKTFRCRKKNNARGKMSMISLLYCLTLQ